MERFIVIPLRKARRGSRERFAPKAMDYLRKFVGRHLKADEVVVGKALNEFIWQNGARNPPRKVRVRATRKGGKAYAELGSVPDAKWSEFIGREEKEKPKPKKADEKKEKPTKAKKEKKAGKKGKRNKKTKKKPKKKDGKKKEPKKKAKKKTKKKTKKKPSKKKPKPSKESKKAKKGKKSKKGGNKGKKG